MLNRISLSSRTFDLINYLFLFLLVLICVYPFYYIFIYSLSIPAEAAKGGLYLWPKGFTLKNYTEVFKSGNLAFAAFISVARTVAGTAITVLCTSMFAYVLTKPNLQYRKVIYRVTISTMYINAGIIPWYITMKTLGLKDNFLLYVIPSAIISFFLVLIKTYIEQLPESLEESAMIDGANVVTIFFRIILPLCKPVLAVVAVFGAVGQWNSWMDSFFLGEKLPTMQLVLLSYLTDQTSNMTAVESNLNIADLATKVTPASIRMTITMIATLPVVFVYPFFQKYFISGIMMGAVKG